MQTSRLNLSSRPFRNLVLPWSVIAVVSLVSLAILLLTLRAGFSTSAKASEVERELKALQSKAAELRKQIPESAEELPEAERVLLQAAHRLIDRKEFGWSRLLSDLEKAIPSDVRVARIKVVDVLARRAATIAELELTVVTKNPSDVTDMIAAMEKGGTFQAEVSSQNLLKGRSETGTEFVLEVRYRPRPLSAEEKRALEEQVAAEAQANTNSNRNRQ